VLGFNSEQRVHHNPSINYRRNQIMGTTQLTTTQTQVLLHALDHNSGRIDWFPDSVKGGARKKVLDGLFNRALITSNGTDWFVAAEGYDALGCDRPVARINAPDPELEASVAQAEATWTQDAVATDAAPAQQPLPKLLKAVRTRADSKQAMVIAMLTRAEGATIKQICEATLWQSHTVRGTLAGAFKKKLGLTITSTKDAGAERCYRISN
jgi:hypothetical protein